MKRIVVLACLVSLALAGGAGAAITNLNTSATYATIQAAIDAASPGDVIHLDDATYVESLNIYIDLTLRGQSQAGVIIDTSPFSDYGLDISGDLTVTLENFTVIGPTPAAYGYGVKVSGDNAQITITGVTVQSSGRSGFDINGASYGLLSGLTATGNGGVGLALTDCSNVTVDGITTSGNAWAGMAVYTMGASHTGGSDNVVLTGGNSFGEPVGLYTETGGGYPITNLSVPTSDFSHLTGNTVYTNVQGYFPSLAAAVAAVLGSGDPAHGYVLDRVTGACAVAPGMSIQAAIDAAAAGGVVEVGAGTYAERLTIGKPLTLLGAQVGVDPTAPGARLNPALEAVITEAGLSDPNPSVLIEIPNGVHGVTVAGFTLSGQPTPLHADDSTIRCGGSAGACNDISIRDNIIEGLYGVLYKGGANLAVERNRFAVNKSGVTVQNGPATAGLIAGNAIAFGAAPQTDPSGVYLTATTGFHLEDNTIAGAWNRGIGGSNNTGVVIARNLLSGNNDGVSLWGGLYGAACADNTIQGSLRYGLNLKGRDIDVTGNLIQGSGTAAINIDRHVIDTERVAIAGNDLSGNPSPALLVSGLVTATVDASGNWWGSALPGTVRAAAANGAADYTPWLASGLDTGAAPGFQGDFGTLWVDDDSPQVGATGRIQEAIGLVSGSTVHVAPGLYEERVVISAPLTLLGATHAVSKKGYAVPAAYAWDTSVESVISYPDPTGLPQADAQLIDIRSDDVVFKGFVVQVLNARCGYNGDNLFRLDAQIAGGPGTTLDGIVVENNVLGPATNVASQDGTCGRMGLYLASPTYPAQRQGITNTLIKGNKIFDALGNGNNVFIWGAAEAYGSLQDADYTGTVIEGNEIVGSHRSGIEIAGGVSGLTIRDNIIAGNSSSNGGSSDPDLKYGNGILAVRMGADKASPTARGVSDLTVTGNQITGNEKNGIYLGPFNQGHLIANNIVEGNGWDGIRIDLTEQYYGGSWPEYGRADDITVSDGVVAGNGQYGARVVGDPTNGFALDARDNWWGDATGPQHPTLNPGGLGNDVSDHVLFEPYHSGNVICEPDPRLINPGSNPAQIVVRYLGGMSAPLYGYSIDLAWDHTLYTLVPAKPDQGAFSAAALFASYTIAPGRINVGAALGGSTPGIASGELMKLTLTAVGTPAYAADTLDLTINYCRGYDGSSQFNLTGYAADDGAVILDFGAPSVSGVAIENDTLHPLTGSHDYVKDTDAVTVWAAVTDGDPLFGAGNITADLTGLGGGGAVVPSGYDSGRGQWYWSVPAATTTPGDGVVTVTVTAVDAGGNSAGGSDTIIADNTPPAPLAGLTAAPGYHKVALSWTDASGNDTHYLGVLVRYARWTGYPVYGGPAPAYPADPTAGDGAAHEGAGVSAVHDFGADTTADRGIYVYGGFVYDRALNFSTANNPPYGSYAAMATNYWLGDVYTPEGTGGNQYNGRVDVSDVSVLGAAYGAGAGSSSDVGPTHDWSRLGIPLPDGVVNFEDLMIFAMNFGVVGPAKQRPAGSQHLLLAWRQVEGSTWSLFLDSPCPALQGVNLAAALPAGAVVQVVPGALLAEQAAPVFVRNIDRNGLDAGAALLGTGAGIAGAGELLRVTFPEGVVPAEVAVAARSIDNEDLLAAVDQSETPSIPAAFRLERNAPNPFNPATRIVYALPSAERVSLIVYTLDGRKVATLVDGEMPAGRHEVVWNGRDDAGRQAASGTYVYRIVAGRHTQTNKMTLTK